MSLVGKVTVSHGLEFNSSKTVNVDPCWLHFAAYMDVFLLCDVAHAILGSVTWLCRLVMWMKEP